MSETPVKESNEEVKGQLPSQIGNPQGSEGAKVLFNRPVGGSGSPGNLSKRPEGTNPPSNGSKERVDGEAKASKATISEVDVKEVILRRVPGDKWKAEFKGRIRQMDINRLTMALRSEWNRHKVARRVARRKAENEMRKELVKNG